MNTNLAKMVTFMYPVWHTQTYPTSYSFMTNRKKWKTRNLPGEPLFSNPYWQPQAWDWQARCRPQDGEIRVPMTALTASGSIRPMVNSPFPALGYANNALEPHIDEMTMMIHHDKHHAGYVAKLNAAIDKAPELRGRSLDQLLKNVGGLPEEVRTAIRNNGGGHWNHSFFWQVMSPNAAASMPSDALRNAMIATWNDMDTFKAEFKKTASGVFGSGWAWVIKDQQGNLKLTSTPNQDNPLMDTSAERGMPILGIDVWEHAYYLKNQNRRGDYIDSFLQVVDWDFVSKQFGK